MHRTSTHLTPSMPEPRVPNRADSLGAQPSWRQKGKLGPVSLSNLPRDVILGILDELRPAGPITVLESTADYPIVNPGHLECRTALLNICLASRAFYELAIPYLYRDPLIKDRREMYRFFCTLAVQADRRPMVRSFAWAGVLWEAHIDAEASTRHRGYDAAILAECWDLIKNEWPHSRVDLEIAKLMGIDGPDTMKDSRLLGSVLAMCPRIKCLFMLNGAIIDPATGIHPCPEYHAIMPFLRRYEFGSEGEILNRTRPYSYPFLHDLEDLTIEGHSNIAATNNTSAILARLFTNAPLLRRVEIKDPPLFREIWYMLRLPQDTEIPLTQNVVELSLLRAHDPQDDMAAMLALFPNLISLYAECRDASSRPPGKLDLPPEVSEALLNVSGTLETLSLTTSPETYPAKGHWVCFESYPSSLSTLNQMTKLKNLTTESIWLFGTEDPAVALHLPHLLPPSLVQLHLIDFWGNYDPDEFYPELPNNWTPLEFYTHVFGALCDECSVRLPELSEVKFTSKRFNTSSQSALLNGGHDRQDETQITGDHMQAVRLSFGQVGVRFRMIL